MQQQPTKPQLVLHENTKFSSPAIHLAGNAFKHCIFDRCTLVMTNAPAHFEGCQFTACNWRIEFDVLHGDPNTAQTLKNLLAMISNPANGAAPNPEGAPDAGNPAPEGNASDN
jgi:hypothetical protein